MMMMMMMRMMMVMMMMLYTLWGGCSSLLLPLFELFPREKISLSIPLEVFSPLGTAVEDTGEGWTNSS